MYDVNMSYEILTNIFTVLIPQTIVVLPNLNIAEPSA